MAQNSPSKIEPKLSPDIDQGWAYVVTLAAFLSYLMILGIQYSSSVFYIMFLDEFEQAPSTTAWVVTVLNFSSMVFGPVESYLTRWFSQRTLIAIGGVISTLGLIASSYVTSLEWMIGTLGIVVGIGWSLPLLFAYTQVSIYFVRKRRLAIAMATTGVAVGQFVYPPLIQALVDEYHWRGAFIVLAGINLNFFVIAAVMMPPREATSVQEIALLDVKDTSEDEEKNTIWEKLKHEVAPLRNYQFNLYSLSALVVGVGLQAFQTHIGNYARIVGCVESQTTALVSCIGIGSLTGRLTQGPVLHLCKLNVILVFNLCFAAAGIVCLLSIVCRVFYGLVILCLIFGYSAGAWSMFSEVVIEIVGIELLAAALGHSFFACSIGSLLGGPVAGWLFELDPSYRVSFIGAGAMLLFSSALNTPAFVKSSRQRRESELESMQI